MICPFVGRDVFSKFLQNFPFEINLHNRKETKESNIQYNEYSEIYTVTVHILFLFKNNSASTTAGISAARFFETKICSLGTDVGGAPNTLAARFRMRG